MPVEKIFSLLVAHYMVVAVAYMVATHRIPRRFGIALGGFLVFAILDPILSYAGIPTDWREWVRWLLGLGVAIEGVRYAILDDIPGRMLKNFRRKIEDEWLEIK